MLRPTYGIHVVASMINELNLDRTVPEAFDSSSQKTKGRPLGLEALWLTKGNPANLGCCIDKRSHQGLKASLGRAESWADRQTARKALWDLRVDQPRILRLFQLEAPPPAGEPIGSEPALWEPEIVF